MRLLKKIRSHKIYVRPRKFSVYSLIVGTARNGGISKLALWERQNFMNYYSIKAFKELSNNPNWSYIKIAAKVKRKGKLQYHLGNKPGLLDNEIKVKDI